MKKTTLKSCIGSNKALFLVFFLLSSVFNSHSQLNTKYGEAALEFNETGQYNSAFGSNALHFNVNGHHNSGVGYGALFFNSSGCENSAFGGCALYFNTTGSANTANGYYSLLRNTSGEGNSAVGSYSLYSNTTGSNNTTTGSNALFNNTTASYNTANGYYALYSNTTGGNNTAIGNSALRNNTQANNNVAIGSNSLYTNISGGYNTANGYSALYSNISGGFNTAIGNFALQNNTQGNYNVAVGSYALYYNNTGICNTAIGYCSALSSPTNLINTTSIGYLAFVSGSNQVRIGNSNVTSIGGQVSWSTLSDGRFKKNVEDNVPGIEFIKQLKPVSYTFDMDAFNKHCGLNIENDEQLDAVAKSEWLKQQKEKETIVYTGFIAQEVDQLVKKGKYNFSGVVAPESEKDYYSIRYAEFVVPLVKTAQLHDNQLNSMKSDIDQLKRENAELKQLVMNLLNTTNIIPENGNNISPITCYPNPSKGTIHLEIKNSKQEAINTCIYNMSGQLLYNKSSNELNLLEEIDLSNEPDGTYIIQTRVGTRTFQNKVILQK